MRYLNDRDVIKISDYLTMPMIPTTMTQMMVSQGAATAITGQQFIPFMNAVSLAVCQYISTSSIVTSSNVVIGPA